MLTKLINWIQMDKITHFGIGYIIMDFMCKFDILFGIIGVLLAATFKELYDSKQPGNKFDKIDWLFTIGGGILNLLVGLI
jgi:hypothetical protein